MCVAAAAIPAASLAISAVSTVASIGMSVMSASQQAAQAQAQMNMAAQQQELNMQQQRQQMMLSQQQQYDSLNQRNRQAQQSANLQVEQANASILNQYNQQQAQVRAERASIMSRHAAEKTTYQRSVEQMDRQVRLNNDAANRAYVQEQVKLNEAKRKAAFEQQALLAKSIGNQGSILASGRTGQSVGLLVQDVERQSGFEIAQQTASIESAEQMAAVSMGLAENKAESANNQAASQVGFNPAMPYLPNDPKVPEFVDPIGLEISRA